MFSRGNYSSLLFRYSVETCSERGREEIYAEEEEKGLREKEEIEYPKQRKSNIENNIIFNLVSYSE
jgi:hypothetical protein